MPNYEASNESYFFIGGLFRIDTMFQPTTAKIAVTHNKTNKSCVLP